MASLAKQLECSRLIELSSLKLYTCKSDCSTCTSSPQFICRIAHGQNISLNYVFYQESHTRERKNKRIDKIHMCRLLFNAVFLDVNELHTMHFPVPEALHKTFFLYDQNEVATFINGFCVGKRVNA